jgi:hypothetical protein
MQKAGIAQLVGHCTFQAKMVSLSRASLSAIIRKNMAERTKNSLKILKMIQMIDQSPVS